jgi:hypothetical protein
MPERRRASMVAAATAARACTSSGLTLPRVSVRVSIASRTSSAAGVLQPFAPVRSARWHALPDGPPPGAPDVDCSDLSGPVWVGPDDTHRLDRDGDGIGCDAD